MERIFWMFGIFASLYLSYMIFIWLFKPVIRKHKKKLRDIFAEEKRQKNKEKFYYIKDVFIAKVSTQILLGENMRYEYHKLISRLDLKTTPEKIRATQVLLFMFFLLLAFLIMYINTILGMVSLFAPFIAWIYPIDEMEKKIEAKNNNIMLDFPAFYSLLYYQYSRSVHVYLEDVVKDFLPNANIDMTKELEVLMDNIEFGEDFALKQFKKRVPLRYVIKFCDIFQTRLNGYDNTSQMGYLKNELDEIRMQKLEEELDKREKSNVQTQFILLFVLGIYVLAYFYFQFMDAIRFFS